MTDVSIRIEQVKRVGTGLALLVFPPMLLVGFLLHPDITSLEMVTEAEAWAGEFRGNFLFHFGHVLVMFVAPLAILVGVRCMRFATGSGAWMIFTGGVLGVFGAFILAVDKGALTLVLTAFDTLPEGTFEQIYPALQVMLERAGWLWIVYLLALLPVGFIVQAIGLAKAGIIGKGQAALIVIGMATLFVGDIEIITAAGAVLMCFGYVPMGMRELRGELGTAL
ncbi:MAG: hypothetical protein OEO79_05455 [Gemmatimonadota bacterium]|nr:hypothetical protein [Gemmatimonadota bacterium]